ncbi:plasmid mobilization protein [Pseudodesulfovibrio senegalensis]|uniref:plasmid mobilization protein n=1 Tax=Pseudodesulfovibrio senegalensis TaxID=1721087 RepID=UPI001F4FAF3B|nr:conjugal transfer protein TraJ [Pseudodesulfovibrio senegalensis]
MLKSYVSDEEYAAIIAKADMTGLSVSTFVKRVSLGHQIVSREDRQARRELLRINADIGRLGGLLKMWLTNEDDFEDDVRILLKEIEQRQAELKKAVGRI